MRPWPTRIRAVLMPCIAVLLLASRAHAQAADSPAPPRNVVAMDHPWDGGDQIDLVWELSLDDATTVKEYLIYRSRTAKEFEKHKNDVLVMAMAKAMEVATEEILGEGWEERIRTVAPSEAATVRAARAESAARAKAATEARIANDDGRMTWKLVGTVPAGRERIAIEKLDRAEGYLFAVAAIDANDVSSRRASTSTPLKPVSQPFDGSRFSLFVIVSILCGAVVMYIQIARSGRPLKVRKIAGLAAVDEAVGRATEMGRSVLFICGTQDMNDIQTIAGLTVLSRVARTAAEYDARVEVPTSRSLVMTTARETVQASFLAAGRPDAYNEDLIYYVTDEQFGFVAYLQGMMTREKPAACFYMGTFFAESLILAETGNSIGAIQIAGTAMPAQLPFFVAACDYTLIGEEFFAASAYLSGEPDQLGSLKGQDVGKVIVAILLIIGVTLYTIAELAGPDTGPGALAYQLTMWLKHTVLT